VLDDLRRRLTATKWPLDAGNDDGYYGVRRSYLAELEHQRGQLPPATRGNCPRSLVGRSVVREFDGLAELGGPAPGLDHPAFRPMLKPLSPAQRPQPAQAPQFLRLFQVAASSLPRKLFGKKHD
jgi:hypothetical protein